MKTPPLFKLCLVTRRGEMRLEDYLAFIKKCAASGLSCVQLREKEAPLEFIEEFAKELQKILKPLGVLLIINDHVELALRINADGVHLGQNDMSPTLARNLLGPKKIIGLSIESFSDLQKANEVTCLDYIAASAVFSSRTKKDCKTLWGLFGVKLLAEYSKHPLIGIGGIRLKNVSSVLQAGASGVAVVHAIHEAPDPAAAVSKFRYLIDQSLQEKLYV